MVEATHRVVGGVAAPSRIVGSRPHGRVGCRRRLTPMSCFMCGWIIGMGGWTRRCSRALTR